VFFHCGDGCAGESVIEPHPGGPKLSGGSIQLRLLHISASSSV